MLRQTDEAQGEDQVQEQEGQEVIHPAAQRMVDDMRRQQQRRDEERRHQERLGAFRRLEPFDRPGNKPDCALLVVLAALSGAVVGFMIGVALLTIL